MSLDSSSYLNRELSWLEFNHRVLEEAQDPTQPLLERLKFLTIVSSNLDEFFEIRVAALKQLVENRSDVHGPDGLRPPDVLAAIRTRVLRMVADQYQLLHETLLPALAHEGLHLRAIPELNDIQIEWARQIFQRDILPILTPLAVDPSHPFPQLLNKSVNLVVLFSKPGYQESTRHAFVQIPRGISRLIALPKDGGNPREFILLSELIRHFVSEVFPGMKIYGAWPTRITRNSELYIDEEEAHNLLLTIEEELQKRNRGAAVRLELTQDCPVEIETYLLGHLHLSHEDVYRVTGPVNLTQLFSLTESGRGLPNLHDPLFTPSIPPPLALPARTFDAIRQNDILLHHPYESFQPIISLLEQAAIDPQVLAIKMTLYRTSGDSPLLNALIAAAHNEKQVTILVELKARFDEANNIAWARKMEEAGIHVVYGLVGLKTHCKILLIVRKEEDHLQSYLHLGTGNYHPRTARFYTDFSLLTCRPVLTTEVASLFNVLTGMSETAHFDELLVAPFNFAPRLLELIHRESAHHRAGRPAGIFIKANALVDPEIIQSLYASSQEGVPIQLLIRGICCLRPGMPGLSENIRVRSIVDRFLEHSRIYVFTNAGDPLVFIGSADLMPRNLHRRVEVVFPILDPELRQHFLDTILPAYTSDNRKARVLGQNGLSTRAPVPSGTPPRRVQDEFLLRYNPKSADIPQITPALWHPTTPIRSVNA
ncbi:MAG TPA: polyphosphate kinase 1 [Verrucomicrobia subdivision 6 bacterium]|nr:polyphosphate kinase 1 [Verrucomicrobia subdivision 6 bacterium]